MSYVVDREHVVVILKTGIWQNGRTYMYSCSTTACTTPLFLHKTGISRAQSSDKLFKSESEFQNIYELTHLQVKQKGKSSVESESLSCFKSNVV